MINLSAPPLGARVLDPFCGTGVVLQEAALMGFKVYGTDLSDKMIDYSKVNLDWLASTHRQEIDATIHQGDAMDTTWQLPVDAVACEGYLGQPFSAPPSPAKLAEVRKTCNYIMSEFLKNIGTQISPGTPLCVGVPAWRDNAGNFTHLPMVDELAKLGYTRHSFENVKNSDLLYYREDQVVARELLVLTKK
jgi:tRNA (guanine10-N2)-dimethyltransferase